jgi:hypothetical protein
MLIGIVGKKRAVIDQLFAHAKTPALVIDCANAANPHRLPICEEQLLQFHIIPVELLYAFRDIVRNLPKGYASIIVTPIDVLLNYQNATENCALYSQAWSSLRTCAQTVYIGIVEESIHQKNAQSYCDTIHMGHTAYSQRVNVHLLQQELRAYARLLRPEDRALFEKLLIYPLQHMGSITFASSMHAWAFQTLSVSLELFKEHTLLKEAHEQLQERVLAIEQRGDSYGNVDSRYVSQGQQDRIVAQARLEKHPY